GPPRTLTRSGLMLTKRGSGSPLREPVASSPAACAVLVKAATMQAAPTTHAPRPRGRDEWKKGTWDIVRRHHTPSQRPLRGRFVLTGASGKKFDPPSPPNGEAVSGDTVKEA